MKENNDKKRFGRRASFGITGIILLTFCYYITLFKNVELGWFQSYAVYVVGLIGFIIGGLTATDIFRRRGQ